MTDTTTETFEKTAERLQREAKNKINVYAKPVDVDKPGGPWIAVMEINGIQLLSRPFARVGAEGLCDRANEAMAELQAMAVQLNKLHPSPKLTITAPPARGSNFASVSVDAPDAAATPVRVELGDAIDDLELSVIRQLAILRETAGLPPKSAIVLTPDSMPTIRRALGALTSLYEGDATEPELAADIVRARAYAARLDSFFAANPGEAVAPPLPTSTRIQGVDCPMCEDNVAHQHINSSGQVVGTGG